MIQNQNSLLMKQSDIFLNIWKIVTAVEGIVIKYFLSGNKMSNLRNLEIAIEHGTYNLEENHSIGNDGQGREVLTVEFYTEDEPIDFLAFTDLVNSHGCVIVQVFGGNSYHVGFSIEEKLPEGN
jgi:hypothetical protein